MMAGRNYFSVVNLNEPPGGEHQILQHPASGGVLKNNDLKDSFCG